MMELAEDNGAKANKPIAAKRIADIEVENFILRLENALAL